MVDDEVNENLKDDQQHASNEKKAEKKNYLRLRLAPRSREAAEKRGDDFFLCRRDQPI